MEVRLNKMISDTGMCSRREADKFIEEGRVTVNGQLPHTGQKVTEADIVLLDDLQIKIDKQVPQQSRTFRGKAQELVFGASEKKEKSVKPQTVSAEKKSSPEEKPKASGSKGLRPGKYVTYNKYAAARHAEREKTEEQKKKSEKKPLIDPKAMREATEPKHGKSLGRSAVAQRLASSPKSAALRKTSKNNPANKAKRAAGRNKSQGE